MVNERISFKVTGDLKCNILPLHLFIICQTYKYLSINLSESELGH